jgi:hypothetical protein
MATQCEGERVMAMLMIKCPQIGQDISTEILTDSDSYRRTPDTLAYTRCPHCAREHAWRHEDAWLVEEWPPQQASGDKSSRGRSC